MVILSLDSSGVYHCAHDFRMRTMYPSTDRYDSLLRALKRTLGNASVEGLGARG